ncbi:MAG: hypothetical protein PHQ54_01635 [Candidatus Omnitrophica bacterium]|nr:hypothetical protein [Candidatus Omnitrophota bacterium]
MLLSWVKFIGYALCLFLFGYISCSRAAKISSLSSITEGFMGVFFLALATSFPEFITSVLAVKNGLFDLALGNIFGSLLSNLFILIFLDLIFRKSGFLKNSGYKNILAVFVLQALMIAAVIYRYFMPSGMSLFNFGFENILVIFAYAVFLKNELSENSQKQSAEAGTGKAPVFKSWIVFLVGLLGIGFFSHLTVIQSKIIVESSGLNYVFFGTLFVGFTTSLPELIVTLSALLRGSKSMAIGNIIGSNAFDIAIIVFLELLSSDMPILGKISLMHINTLFFVQVVTLALFVLLMFKKFNKIYGIILLILLILPLIIIF